MTLHLPLPLTGGGFFETNQGVTKMEFLAWLIHALFGKKESAKSAPDFYTSTDGKRKIFNNYEDLRNTRKKRLSKMLNTSIEMIQIMVS